MGTKAWGAAALLVAALWVDFGLAADWSVVPSINAKTEFNSNLNASFDNKLSDYIFTLTPATEFNYTTEASQLQGRLGLTGLKYISHTEFDHVDQSYQINGQYRLSPRWNLILNSSFIVDSTQTQELLASGLIMNRTPRRSFTVGPGITFNVTERLGATVNYTFNQVNYQDPQFQNYINQAVGLNLTYPLKNQKTSLLGNILGRESRYPSQGNIFRSLGINLGAKHMFSENWEANFLGGVNISFLDFQTQVADPDQSPFFITIKQARQQETNLSPFFNVSTTRRWTNLSITGGYALDQSASAFGSISETNRLFLNLNYNFSEKLSGSLGGIYNLSNQVSQEDNFQSDNLSVTSQVTYRVTEKLSMAPGYRFSQQDDITNSRSAKVHNVWLMLTYSYPIHYQK
ncbi:MAG: outer membrane beta-barrel protein [Candidatus Schekmanbacteria bacterium]|nr:outer membrane beta-barrel protein [Candidatus Schekmanbacteria bacterium]